MEYAYSVWGPSTKENIKKLEQIQNRAARFITRSNEYSQMTKVTQIVKSLILKTLEVKKKGKVIIIHKALNHNLEIQPNKNLFQCSDKHRDRNTFFIPYARTNAYKYSFFLSGIRAWNGLPEQARKTNNLA
jgi:hypothetical protein